MVNYGQKLPLLSIIIPTRNRQKYAISAITSILDNISTLDLELVVQDNSDSRDLEEYICSNVKDSRLRYNYTPTPLSFVENFNTAVKLASGKYLCIIGDDDGVNPEIIGATRWADKNNIDALNPIIRAVYFWPESGVPTSLFIKNVSTSGVFRISLFSGKFINSNPKGELKKLVQNGGFRYLETEIPRLYHGIVKRKCLDKIRKKTGVFFGGLTPDVYIAVSIANFAKNVVSIDYPLTIAGASKPSSSAQSLREGHVGNLEDAPHFQHRGAYQWAEIVPRFYSVETIWADSVVAALRTLKLNNLLRDFNLSLLSAHCIIYHPKYSRIVLRDMYRGFRIMNKNQLIGTFQLCYSLLLCCFKREFLTRFIPKGIKHRIKHLLVLFGRNNNIEIDNVEDIVKATEVMINYLREKGKRFSDLVNNKTEYNEKK